MTEPPRNPEPQAPGSLLRDVAALVLVGVALGLAHNWFMLQNGPGKGLAWIKAERKVVRLEDVTPADSASTPAGASAAPVAADPARAPATASKRPAEVAKPVPGNPAITRPAAPAGKSAAAPADTKSAAAAVPPAAPPPTSSAAAGSASPPPAAASTPAVDAPAIPESREPMESGLATVRRLYAANAAVFVDARSPDEYAEGHIAGAVSLPFDDVFKNPDVVKKIDDRGLPIVTYCGGGDCDLSRNLAFSFIDAGRKRVLVFLGGLPEWKGSGLPVRTGAQP